MKHLNFSVAETTGRTFDLPLETAIEIIKRLQAEDEFLQEDNVDFNNEVDVASFFNRNGLLDELYKYERDNSVFDSVVVDTKTYEE